MRLTRMPPTQRLGSITFRSSSRASALAVLLAAGLIVGAWGVDLRAWIGTGLRPEVHAHGATVYALLAWQGWFAAIVAIMGLYIGVRCLAGHMQADRPTTGDIIALSSPLIVASLRSLVRLFAAA